MRFETPAKRLILFAGLFALGNIIMGGILALIASRHGYDIMEFGEVVSNQPEELPHGILRSLIWIQTLCLFVLPALIFAIICYRTSVWSYFSLNTRPLTLLVFLSIVFLVTGYPLVSLSYDVNSLFPIPDWARDMESSASAMLDQVLVMDTPLQFLTTFTIVAILPAIGEELVFRGVLQKQVQQLTGRGILAVWIAAIIFSSIHFQFEGFLPRVILGAIMGYLYLWTSNLWIPIIVHLFNNGFQVAVLYFSDIDMRELQSPETMSPGVIATIVSIFLFILTALLIIKVARRVDTGNT